MGTERNGIGRRVVHVLKIKTDIYLQQRWYRDFQSHSALLDLKRYYTVLFYLK